MHYKQVLLDHCTVDQACHSSYDLKNRKTSFFVKENVLQTSSGLTKSVTDWLTWKIAELIFVKESIVESSYLFQSNPSISHEVRQL